MLYLSKKMSYFDIHSKFLFFIQFSNLQLQIKNPFLLLNVFAVRTNRGGVNHAVGAEGSVTY